MQKVGKLGRKIYCDFNNDVKCILLIKGHKRCVFEETNEKQRERGEQQLGVCGCCLNLNVTKSWPRSKKKGFQILEVGRNKKRQSYLWVCKCVWQSGAKR